MAKKPEKGKAQPDSEDELLNFDLEELSDGEAAAEDEVIELVELIETAQDDDRTKELPRENRIREKPVVKPAKGLLEDEEEIELDLSDLTLDMDVEETRPVQRAGEDDITESDLENLLQETSDEEITYDLPSDEESAQAERDEEVTDADLEALLQEATVESVDEAEGEKALLEAASRAEAAEEIQLEEERPSFTEIEAAADSFDETQLVIEPLVEEEAPAAARPELGRLLPEEPVREEPSVEALTGMSEERLEEIITRVVEEVVERVARQTMASVAERVIGEAIAALKVSLENSSEES
jgi:hypothetical protein